MIEARGSRAALARAYSLFSFFYGGSIARLEQKAVERGLERAHVQPGERVLDVAVGPGHIHRQLQQGLGGSGYLVGVELAPGMLRVAQRRLPGARLLRADARRLPFADESFDLLWSSYLLDLIPTQELAALLGEFCRVLKPGGRLLLVNLSKQGPGLTRWERLYRRTPGFLVPYLFGGCRPVEAAPFARQAGFVEVEREFVPGGLDSEIVTARK